MKTRYWTALGILAATTLLVAGYQMNDQPYTPKAPRDPNNALAQFYSTRVVQTEQPVGETSGQALAAVKDDATTSAIPQGVCPMTGKTVSASGMPENCPHAGQPGQTCCPQ